MKTRSLIFAGVLAALLGLSPIAHGDPRHDPPGWGARHGKNDRYQRHYQPRRHPDRIQHYSYRRGYRDGHRDHYRRGYWYTPPRYYGPGGYGFNVWLDGIGVTYYDSDGNCH